MKTAMKQNETLILSVVGASSILLILCGFVFVWSRPKYMYMPIYENYERDSNVATGDDAADGTELAEGHLQHGRDGNVLL